MRKPPKMARTPCAQWLHSLPKPIGLMACYDLAGVRVLQTCNQAGIDVPGAVAVIGVNNDPIQCVMTNPPMSSVVQNQVRLGYDAGVLLYRLIRERFTNETADGTHQDRLARTISVQQIPPLGVAARQSTDIIVVPDPLVVRAIRLIREHACSGFSVTKLAEELRVERRTLERRFRKIIGRSPHDEISETQIRQAKELLRFTRLTVAAITRRVGFKSVPHFTAQFIKYAGERPGEYRSSVDMNKEA
ncbi:MAG: helix-turn-helix domain-containing protein [Thermoguttaceae bacterium]